MPLDFPDSPVPGQLYSAAGSSWKWDGAKWLSPMATGGPWLPLSGGTVTGPTFVADKMEAKTFETYTYRMQTGGALNTALGIYGDLSGTQTTGNNCFARISLLNDTLAAGGAGLVTFLVDQHSGGVGSTGNRVGAYINFNHAGGTTNKSLGIGDHYAGLWTYSTVTGNVGGATGAGNRWGTLWGGVISAHLDSGSTFWNGCCGLEVDAGVSTGASANYVQGLKVVIAHHQQVVQSTDYIFGMAKLALTDVGIGNGIAFGSVDGYWPIAASGTLIGAQASIMPTPPAMTAAHGVDFSNVTFSADAFRSNGFRVDPTGAGSFTSLTASLPSGNDPLHVTVAAGAYARINYTVTGARSWTTGVFPDGSFVISDESAGGRVGIGTSGLVTVNSGLSLANNVATDPNDVTKHLALYATVYGFSVMGGLLNYVAPAGAAHRFLSGGVTGANITATVATFAAVQTGGASGATFTSGTGAPSSPQQVGSIYSRTDGAAGSHLYVSQGGGVWTAVAGV